MIANIDGDLVAYRSAASCTEEDSLEVALHRTDQLIRQLLHETQSDQYNVYLSHPHNFRKEIYSEYKANRKDQVTPIYLHDCKDFLISEWKAKMSEWLEADDLLGINQTSESVCVSLDKDLQMIPGTHYSWEIGTIKWSKPASWSEILYLDGLKTFYKQMLIGDPTDNIIGVAGLGKVKSAKLIDPLETEEEMFEMVLDKYNYDYKRFLINGACLWIMRSGDETWLHHLQKKPLISSDELKQEVDHLLKSMKFFNPMEMDI